MQEKKPIEQKVKSMLLAVLKDPSRPQEHKNIASKILTWYAGQITVIEGESDLDLAVRTLMTEFRAECLWTGVESFVTKKTDDGDIETIVIESNPDAPGYVYVSGMAAPHNPPIKNGGPR